MRLKIKVACLILSLLLLTGCGNIIDQNSSQSPHKYAVTTFNEVFELIQAKDSRAIFDKFNEDARTNANIMPQIKKLVEFMDGEITEIGHVGASNAYSSVRDGVTVSAAYTATADVRNDKGVLYWVKVDVITADEDKTKLGLDWIYILDCEAFDAYVKECSAWNERRINGAKEPEPERPDDMEIGVHYFKFQK